MTQTFFLVYFVYAVFFHQVWAKSKSQTLVRLDSFGNCPGPDKLLTYYNESGVEPSGKTSVGYGTLIVERTIKSLEKGVYRIHQATVDVRKLALIKFPTDGYWRISLEAHDEFRKIHCFSFAGKFIKVRV